MSTGRNFKKILEKMGGSEKAKPHSTKEGKVASGARRLARILEKQKPKTAQPTPMPKYTPRPTGTKGGFGAAKRRAKHNIGGRANLLEEMGRIDARRHPDAADRAEKRRVIGELNRGYKSGGSAKGPNRPRPTGPHMWVRGDKRKKYAAGSIVKGAIKGAKKIAKGLGSGIKPSEAKEVLKSPGKSWGQSRAEYLRQWSPHFGGRNLKKEMKVSAKKSKKYASGGVVMAGKKVGCQIK